MHHLLAIAITSRAREVQVQSGDMCQLNRIPPYISQYDLSYVKLFIERWSFHFFYLSSRFFSSYFIPRENKRNINIFFLIEEALFLEKRKSQSSRILYQNFIKITQMSICGGVHSSVWIVEENTHIELKYWGNILKTFR